MKFHILSLAFAAYVTTVAAQGIDSLPPCAQSCATNSIPSSCNPIDFACICSNKSFITNISCCVFQSCAADQQQAVIQFADSLCSGVGVTDLPKSATCAAGASTSSTKNSETTTSSTSSSSTTPASNTASETSSATTTSTRTATSSAKAAATSSAGAVPAQHKDASLIAAAGAAAAFALLV